MEKFPTGALAVLETDAAGWRDVKKTGARLTAFIRPRDLD
jgi:phosphohistidine phosphatase